MAITSFDTSCDKIPKKSLRSTHSSKGWRLRKVNSATGDGSLSSGSSKRDKQKKMFSKSPYLAGDRVQLLSRVTEKRLVHKKTTDFVSSFPMAANLYKANSDEFKSPKKANKKVKKSVLTLPNDPAPTPQVCTVSDMTDSEYFDKNHENRKPKAIKKRSLIQNNRKARAREKDFEFYDRDAKYCSQLNINLDCSSTDMMKNFNGDGKRMTNKKKIVPTFNKPQTASDNLSDVWTVLRNINGFQFRPSPPGSEESTKPVKKKVQKRRPNRKDTRVIETCRTEEFAYISSYELDHTTPHNFSQSSSTDRITVIDKKNEFSKICEEFGKRFLKKHDFLKDSNATKNRNLKNKIQCKNTKNNVRAITNGETKENKQVLHSKKKKKTNFKNPVSQGKSEPMNSSENRDSSVDVDNLPISDHSDIFSYKTANDSTHAAKGSFLCSDLSGISKDELLDKKKNETVDVKDKSPVETSLQLKGITRVVLNNEQDSNINSIVSTQCDLQKRKLRLVTTMPSSYTAPKLTQTEIKRRLAHIKFPLVILGKDQVSSSVPVENYDPPQFNGLDDHIWPFMIEWCEHTNLQPTKDPNNHGNIINRKCNSYLSDNISSKSRKTNTEVSAYKQAVFKDNKKQANNDSAINKKKAQTKRPTPYTEISEKLLQSSRKQRSIVLLKDKMLNFLYKKSSIRNVINENHQTDENDAIKSAANKVDAITNTQLRSVMGLNDIQKRRASSSSSQSSAKNKKSQNYAYPWAKAKWASDFIENVIKKIRSGVYYTQDHRDVYFKYQIAMKEVSVQAESLCDSFDSTRLCDATNESNFTSIPGFNDTLPLLEIKTLNMNQIAVKHCVTNIMVQFDVTVPTNNNQNITSTNTSSPLIPIEVTDSQTKIYKCKTTIVNAMLPAELCSILPRMMSNIIDTNVSSDLLPMNLAKTDSFLSTITELARNETADSISIITSFHMSSDVKHMLKGRFPNKLSFLKQSKPNRHNFRVNYNYDLVRQMLLKIWLKDFAQYVVSPLVLQFSNTKQIYLQESNKPISGVNDIQNVTCTSMEVYTDRNKINSAFRPYNLVGMIVSILNSHNLQINVNLNCYFNMLKLQYDGKNIEINMSVTNSNGVQKNMSVNVSNLKIESLYQAFSKIDNNRNKYKDRNNTPLKCIEHIKTPLASKSKYTEVTQVTGNKIKRKGFYKLFRKCKSTTNIPMVEKCPNTPLNKITNLDDFFQILGSKKILCSVLDGYSAKKILSSIVEMKNWITEINPKQALLILLLTNKKDTPNLVRFRPILLQGIAVNRITRATELDMEIEVIERENLHKFSQQYEGISYLPETVTNYDNLLEELYWIAKTTASDYQKPFDESSERLLKSLLGKRKKLNPSYLRVMARYVGLGLLKSPTKNIK